MASKFYKISFSRLQSISAKTNGLAAWFGLTEVTSMLLQNGHLSDCKDKYDRTPLSWAAEKGDEAGVKLLAYRDDVEVDLIDGDGRRHYRWPQETGPSECLHAAKANSLPQPLQQR